MIKYVVYTSKTLTGLDGGSMNPVDVVSEFIVTGESLHKALEAADIVADAEGSTIYGIVEVNEEE